MVQQESKPNVLIGLNKDEPSISETFISNHILYFGACTINVYRYSNIFKEKELKRPISLIWLYLRSRIKLRDLKRLIKSRQIQVFLAEYGQVGADSVRLAQWLNLPLVIHFHGHEAYRRSMIIPYGERYKTAFQKASAIIAVSQHMKKQLVELGAPETKVFLNFYGVDLAKFITVPQEKKQRMLLSVGRFVDKKAPYFTLMAFHRVSAQYPDINLVMVGDGHLLNSCKNLAAYLGLRDRVLFTGAIPHEEVAEWYRKAMVYVQHSLTADDNDTEGTPNSILEAGASGLPVVSTRHAGIPEVVLHGSTGFLVEEGDVAGMADYMAYLLNHPELISEMGIKARRHIEENYSLDKSLNGLRSICASVI